MSANTATMEAFRESEVVWCDLLSNKIYKNNWTWRCRGEWIISKTRYITFNSLKASMVAETQRAASSDNFFIFYIYYFHIIWNKSSWKMFYVCMRVKLIKCGITWSSLYSVYAVKSPKISIEYVTIALRRIIYLLISDFTVVFVYVQECCDLTSEHRYNIQRYSTAIV